MTNKDGGPAFPCETISYEQGEEGDPYSMKIDGHYYRQKIVHTSGMSLRDWFAGLALQGYLASEHSFTNEGFAINSYAIADAMLKERDNEKYNP